MIQNLKKSVFAVAVGVLAFASPAVADDNDRCLIAQQHAKAGYEAYLPKFKKAVRFLNDHNIRYIKTGLGKSDSSKFSIDVSFSQARSPDTAPMVLIKPLPGSHDTQFGYVLVGYLTSSIYHSDCVGGNDTSVFGHIWTKTINQNTTRTKKALTSLSEAGFIANGYYAGLASYQTNFDMDTYIIKIEDFNTGALYQQFRDILDTMPYGGTD